MTRLKALTDVKLPNPIALLILELENLDGEITAHAEFFKMLAVLRIKHYDLLRYPKPSASST